MKQARRAEVFGYGRGFDLRQHTGKEPGVSVRPYA